MAKKKRPGFVRTTISLPAELRKRMNACGGSVNWSAIAAYAFAAEVARINTRKDGAKMDDVIERLRASAREEDSEVFQQGREVGIEWAKADATARELRRLQQSWDSKNFHEDENDWLSAGENNAFSDADIFVWKIRPGDEGRVGDDFFNEEVFGGNCELAHLTYETEFIHGFAAGALEVWAEVADKV